MKRYIAAVLASAGLALGSLTSFAGPGPSVDRPFEPNPASDNPANGNPMPAGAEESSSSLKATAENPASFIPKAYEADQAEIRMSQLAQERASSDQVKSFAQTLIRDHQAHAQKVQQLAQQKNIPVSDQLSADCQKGIDELSVLNGAAFDRHFLRDMVRDHKKAIKLYKDAAADNTDADVKTLAQATLPTLHEHLRMAENAGVANEPAGATLPR